MGISAMINNPNGRFRRRAATVVETSFVLSACLIFIFAIFEFGRILMERHLVDNAAREGARQAIMNTGTLTTSDIQTTVTNYLAGQQFQSVTINVYQADPATGNNIGAWNNATYGNSVAVDVSAVYKTMLPGLGWLPNTVTIRGKSVMRCESN
jgi:Flp pilus assembly protein TadG